MRSPSRHWITWVLSLVMILSLSANVWLCFKVIDYKNRTWQAKLFPDVVFHSTRPVTTDPPKVDEIWLLGDSRVEMWPKQSFPSSWHVNLLGGGGFTLREAKTGLQDALARSTPKGIILQCGINDVQGTGYEPETRPKVMEHAERHFREILMATQQRHIPLLVTSILPRGPRTLRDRWFWSEEMDAQVEGLNAKFAAICQAAEIRFFDCGPILCDDDKLIKSAFAFDTLHLNQVGYDAFTPKVIEFMESVVLSRH